MRKLIKILGALSAVAAALSEFGILPDLMQLVSGILAGGGVVAAGQAIKKTE